MRMPNEEEILNFGPSLIIARKVKELMPPESLKDYVRRRNSPYLNFVLGRYLSSNSSQDPQ